MDRKRRIHTLKIGFLVLMGVAFVVSPFLPVSSDLTRMVGLVSFGMMSGAWIIILLDRVYARNAEMVGQ